MLSKLLRKNLVDTEGESPKQNVTNNKKDLFRDFFDASRDLFCIIDSQGTIEHTNAAVTRLLGYLPRELFGKQFIDHVHPDDIDETERAMASLSKGVSLLFENRFLAKSGEYHWLSWSGSFRNGEMYVAARDVTEVKNDQRSLQIAQERLRLLYEAVSNPRHTLWQKIDHVLDLGNKELATQYASIGCVSGDSITIIRQKSKEDPIFKEGLKISLEETFSRYALEAEKPFAIQVTKESVYDTHPAHQKNGLETYIGVPLWVAGEIYGTVNFSSKEPRSRPFEITDLDFVLLIGQWIGSTMALISANEHIAYNAAIVESSDDAIIGQSLDGTITAWNKGAEELFEYKKEEILGENISIIVPEDLHHEINQIRNRLLKKEQVAHYDTIRMRKGLSTFNVSINMSPILNEEGQIVGISSVIRDITKEKEIDRAKSEFVSLASHQLRTPLSAINWYSELLQDEESTGKLNEEQQDFLNEIHLAQKRMTSLVGDLLNVSRIELGTFSITPEEVDIVEVSDSVLKEIEHTIKEKKQHIETKYPAENLSIMADRNLLRTVFQNLISNAVKYTPNKGTISVRIWVDSVNKKVRIDIKDTGYGVPKNQQSQIFSKLFRADNILDKETSGSGLGLYIVKSILDESGGSISFESEENKGTVFHLTVPLSGMKKREGKKKLA